MRAARFWDKGDIRVEDIDEPKVKDGQVLVDVVSTPECNPYNY